MRHCLTSGAVRVVECVLSNSEVSKMCTHAHTYICTYTVCPESYCTHTTGEHCYIYLYNLLLAESDCEELQNLLKLLLTIFRAN